MVVGKDMIYFALLDNDDVIDCIPLYEILLVKKMGSDAGNDLNLSNFHRKTSPHSGGGNEQLSSDGFHQTLRIDTKPEGYNSGRTYYLQIGSDAEFSRLAISLLYYVKDAIKRFEAKTGLERSQAKVRSLFRSPPFQFTASFFILAVNFPFSYFLFASKNFIHYLCLSELFSKYPGGTKQCLSHREPRLSAWEEPRLSQHLFHFYFLCRVDDQRFWTLVHAFREG